MNKFYTIIASWLLLMASTVVATAATVQPEFDPLSITESIPEWGYVGHDTCKVNPGCTPEWAMDSFRDAGVIPASVAIQAKAAFKNAAVMVARGETPDWSTYYVCEGDVVASSFSNKDAKLTTVREIRATFKGCTPGLGWTFYDYEGNAYEVFRVIECGNYTVRRVVAAVAYAPISGPLLASFVPHHFYDAGHNFDSVLVGFGGRGSSGTTNLFVTNVTNQYCDVCCDPVVDHPAPETPAPVPLPASGLLLFFGLIVLSLAARRLKTKRI